MNSIQSIVGTIVIEDVLCDLSDELSAGGPTLSTLVESLRPIFDRVASACCAPQVLNAILPQQRELAAQIAYPLGVAAFDLFVNNLMDAI